MRAHGAFTALVSGGFRWFTSRIAAEIGFDHDEANDLLVADGKVTGKLHWEIGSNALEAGVWAETDKYHRTQARYNTVDGTPDSETNPNVMVYLRRDYRSKRDRTSSV